MKMNALYIVTLLVFVLVFGLPLLYLAKTGLRREKGLTPLPAIGDVPAQSWKGLANARIFFGHQSVGFNIVNGLEDITRQGGPAKLNIVETYSPADFTGPVFAHAPVGKNSQPMSKIERFVEIMDAGAGDKVDIAFLKFCYVDVTNESDPCEIFEKYKTAISGLEKRYPNVKFVHLTVPLRSAPKGFNKTFRSFIKWLFRMPTALDDNLKREEYNKLIRDAYAGSGRIFDLAHVESVGQNSRSCYVARENQQIPFMAPEYTDDGGHLNQRGRKAVAEQMLIFLCGILAQ
jgi:hypothetical protein